MGFGQSKSRPAYNVVDISNFSEEVQVVLKEDAADGGTQYGLRVVEEYINGPSRSQVYGVYGGEDAEKWQAALGEIGQENIGNDEEAVRAVAEEAAAADAAAKASAQERSVRAVTDKEGDTKGKK